MNYEELLEKAYREIKPIETGKRFEIPEANIFWEGNKTIITNFPQICSVLRRKPEHLAKFLFKELATSGTIESSRLTLNRKVKKEKVDEKIKEYAKEFVICPECKKPDTELIREGRFVFLHCLACGAKHSVSIKI